MGINPFHIILGRSFFLPGANGPAALGASIPALPAEQALPTVRPTLLAVPFRPYRPYPPYRPYVHEYTPCRTQQPTSVPCERAVKPQLHKEVAIRATKMLYCRVFAENGRPSGFAEMLHYRGSAENDQPPDFAWMLFTPAALAEKSPPTGSAWMFYDHSSEENKKNIAPVPPPFNLERTLQP